MEIVKKNHIQEQQRSYYINSIDFVEDQVKLWQNS